jgi:hypothetical protein
VLVGVDMRLGAHVYLLLYFLKKSMKFCVAQVS